MTKYPVTCPTCLMFGGVPDDRWRNLFRNEWKTCPTCSGRRFVAIDFTDQQIAELKELVRKSESNT